MTKKRAESVGEKPKYSPTPEERAAIEKAFDTRKKPPAPRLKIENSTLSLDHPDQFIGQLLLENALGTLNWNFANGLLEQLAQASSRGSKISESDLNFMFAVIKDIEPRDQIESMLAAQMAAVHMAMMRFVRQLAHVENIPQQDSAERTLNKLARTFTTQMEALKRYRTGEQKVTVQHVTVGEGGQAIVGNVTQSQRDVEPNVSAVPPLAVTHDKTEPMPLIESKKAAPIPVEKAAKKK